MWAVDRKDLVGLDDVYLVDGGGPRELEQPLDGGVQVLVARPEHLSPKSKHESPPASSQHQQNEYEWHAHMAEPTSKYTRTEFRSIDPLT